MASPTRRTRSRPSPALIVAALALVAALAGTAVAEPTANTAISKKKTKKIADNRANKQIDTRLPWGTDDIADAAVTTDKIGDGSVTNGKLSNPTYWAQVAANGNFVRGNGATTSVRINNGNYRAEFDTDISECTFQATPRNVNQSLTAHADLDAANNQRVFVSLRASNNGVRTDGNFQVAVNC
jgi:hypothetical protein